jgi:hypothetical protein
MPALRREIARAGNILLESNSVLRFLAPDLYAAVLDPRVADFKPSSLRYLDRADALLLPAPEASLRWPCVSGLLLDRTPRFAVPPPAYRSPAFTEFVRERITH